MFFFLIWINLSQREFVQDLSNVIKKSAVGGVWARSKTVNTRSILLCLYFIVLGGESVPTNKNFYVINRLHIRAWSCHLTFRLLHAISIYQDARSAQVSMYETRSNRFYIKVTLRFHAYMQQQIPRISEGLQFGDEYQDPLFGVRGRQF